MPSVAHLWLIGFPLALALVFGWLAVGSARRATEEGLIASYALLLLALAGAFWAGMEFLAWKWAG